MKQLRNIVAGMLVLIGGMLPATTFAQEPVPGDTTATLQQEIIVGKDTINREANRVDVKGIVFGHIGDSYEWHITNIGKTSICIPLPIIVYSETSGWHAFLSSRLEENGGKYEGFYIAPAGSKYEGKIVERNATGEEVRPWDISITKVTLSLFINSAILLAIILSVAHWYRKREQGAYAPGGFIGFMEMFIMMVHDDVIKSCVGPNYKKFAPYLLTAFFFIFINNIMGLIPIFPGGANVTGNIAITLVLALFTFVIVNIFGTKHYWKDIFWPRCSPLMAEGTYTHDAVYRIFRCIYQTVCLDDPSVCQHVVRTHGHVSAYLPDIYIGKHGTGYQWFAYGGFRIIQHLYEFAGSVGCLYSRLMCSRCYLLYSSDWPRKAVKKKK